MEYVYLSAIIGLCFFNFFAYRRGLKDGLALNQGKPIEPIQNPVQAVTKAVEKRHKAKEEDKIIQGIQNILSYDGSEVKDEKE